MLARRAGEIWIYQASQNLDFWEQGQNKRKYFSTFFSFSFLPLHSSTEAHRLLGKKNWGGKTKHPSALADSQGSLLCLSVPHCGVGEEGTEHQRVAKPRSVAWLEQQGLQCHQSSLAASEQSCRQQLPSPCQRRLRPLAQNANPAPQPQQGRSKHTNQFNSSTRGIRGGSCHCHERLAQQQNAAELGILQEIQTKSWFAHLYLISSIFVFILLFQLMPVKRCIA